MIEILEKIPVEALLLLVLLAITLLVIFLIVAIRQGRELVLWPPKLGQRPISPTPQAIESSTRNEFQLNQDIKLKLARYEPVEIVDYTSINWDALIESSKHTFRANGFALVKIVELNCRRLLRKIKENDNFYVEVFIGDPFSPAAAMRASDENDNYLAPQVIARVAIRFDDSCNELRALGKESRFILKHFSCYPTMAVVIIDDDLFVYFYPFGKLGTDSPIIIFREYKKHAMAQFFIEHYESIARQSYLISHDKLATLVHALNLSGKG